MSNNWIAVASADHVQRGVAGGFMQVCHGKEAPLRRIRPGDRICYYSPTDRFGGSRWLRAFTAFGTVAGGEPYRVVGGDGHTFHRRDVVWMRTKAASIYDLLAELDLTSGCSDWGVQFRYGLLRIGDADAARIAAALGITPSDGAIPSQIAGVLDITSAKADIARDLGDRAPVSAATNARSGPAAAGPW